MSLPILSTADSDELILSRVLPNRSLKYPIVRENMPIVNYLSNKAITAKILAEFTD
jgi:hypothetical protein